MAMDSDFKKLLRQRYANRVVLKTVEIQDALLSPSIKLVNNVENITVNGTTFSAYTHMSIIDSPQTEGDAGETTLTIFEIDLDILFKLEALPPCRATLAKVIIQRVTAADATALSNLQFNQVQTSDEYELRSYSMSGKTLTLQLGRDTRMSEPIPKDLVIPQTHPGAFGSK